MNHEKSNTEILKANDMYANPAITDEMLIDMLIYEAQLTYTRKNLKEKIDHALDKRDKELFMKLSTELVELEKNSLDH